MLVLNASSVCDICRESLDASNLPHSIPCGHVLCAGCCTSIVEKTPSRLTPACPFCREHFTLEGVRRIRIDFSASGWTSPPLKGGTVEANQYVPQPAPQRSNKTPGPMFQEQAGSRSRAEARRLEDKVAMVAAKKCSVEEVSTLHKELQEWLMSDIKSNDKTSLSLSAALLRAILMNHLAHSDANKAAKAAESNLKSKIDDLELKNAKMEAELTRLKSQYAAKVQESQTLLSEVSRLQIKAGATLSPPPSSRSSSLASQSREARRQSISSLGAGPPPPPPSTPVPFSSASSSAQSPLARFNSVHARSVSASHNAPVRSATPAGTSPSFYAPARSSTPVGTSSMSRSRSSSISPPPQISRSSSDEKRAHHERWMPTRDPASYGKPFSSASAASRVLPQRYGTPVQAT